MRWHLMAFAVALAALSGAAQDRDKAAPGDAPMFGGTPARNMANAVAKNIPDDFGVGKGKDKKTTHLKWTAAVGSRAFGGPVIAGGRVFIGTNNERPRDPKVKGDKGVLMCFRESDGKFLWQIVHDKLPAGEVNDYPKEGVASAPCVDGDRLYYVSNRCELVCADVQGDEKTGKGKVLWKLDMIKEEGVFPCQLANSSPMVVGDLVYALTGNGIDIGTNALPAPKAPALVAVNKKTGKLAWSNNLPGPNVMRGQWSNPTAATINNQTQIIYAGGDGWLYGLDAVKGDLLWKFDLNPKGVKPYQAGGSGEKCFVIATPVVVGDHCYVAVGQEPDDGVGVGHLWCVNITKRPKTVDKDVSPVGNNFDPRAPVNKDSALVWHYGGKLAKPTPDGREYVFGRTLGTVAVYDGLVYAADLAGYLHCVDAKTGQAVWIHDFQESTWCSPYYVDGKVFVGTDSGELLVYKAGRKENAPKKIFIGQNVKIPPVAANGTLFINGGTYIYAIAPAKK